MRLPPDAEHVVADQRRRAPRSEASCSRIARSTCSRASARPSSVGAGGGARASRAQPSAARARATAPRRVENASKTACLSGRSRVRVRALTGAGGAACCEARRPRRRPSRPAPARPRARRRRRRPAGTSTRRKPRRAASRRRRSRRATRRTSPPRPDLAAGGGVGRERQVEPARREGERDTEVGRGLRHPHAAGHVHVDVAADEVDVAPPVEHGEQQRDARRRRSRDRCDAPCRSRRARRAPGARAASAASPRAPGTTQVPGALGAALREEELRGIRRPPRDRPRPS